MFSRLPDAFAAEVLVSIDGKPFAARSCDTVASALLASGRSSFGVDAAGALRGPRCLAGHCFACVVTIDGHRGRRACLVQVEPGMTIETGATGTR